MSTTSDQRDGLVPLAERIRWSALMRCFLALAPIPLWYLQPVPPIVDARAVIAVAGVYFWLGVASAGLVRLPRRLARVGLTLGLLLDGLYLAWAFFALADLDGTGGTLVILHVMGISLLMSFRSGLKVAMWHSLLGLLVLQARSDAAFLPLVPEPLQPLPTLGLALHLALVWTAAATTATFAAVNERELRRRRYDAEALRRFGFELEACFDPARILELLATFGRRELLARRVVATMWSSEPHEEAFDGTTHRPSGDRGELVLVDGEGPALPQAAPELDDASIVHRAHRGRETMRCREAGDADGSWLEGVLPDASNFVVVPVVIDDPYFGAVVLEYGPASRWRRTRRIERRLVATAEQAAAQGGLALGRALLLSRLQEAAQTDGLTQIANRSMFDEALERECDRSLRTGAPVSVVLLDLDEFKILNDTHGHLEGDQALRDVARTLRRVRRHADLPARYGGEEFAVLLLGAGPEDAAVAAERFRAAIEQMDRDVQVTASVGVASWPTHGLVARELVAAADDALYAAKDAGRNCVVVSPWDRARRPDRAPAHDDAADRTGGVEVGVGGVSPSGPTSRGDA